MRLPSFCRQRVVILRQETDRYGDWRIVSRTPVERCSFQQTAASETQNANDRSVTTYTLIGPPLLAAARLVDAIEFEGERYQIEGDPAHWPSHVEMRLRRVEG